MPSKPAKKWPQDSLFPRVTYKASVNKAYPFLTTKTALKGEPGFKFSNYLHKTTKPTLKGTAGPNSIIPYPGIATIKPVMKGSASSRQIEISLCKFPQPVGASESKELNNKSTIIIFLINHVSWLDTFYSNL